MPAGAYIRVAKRDLSLASVRYRGLLPGCALEELGWNVVVGADSDLPAESTGLVIAVKPLSIRDAAWVRAVARPDRLVIADLCDNVFVDGYAGQGVTVGRRFSETCAWVDAVTVPTEDLRSVVVAQTALPDERVLVVPDIVETASLLNRQRRLLGQGRNWRGQLSKFLRVFMQKRRTRPTLLWYGNHGAPYANFGMDDLLLFHEALSVAASYGSKLLIVSNSRERFERLATSLPIESHYFEWTPHIVDELLAEADICLVPNSGDEFSRTKSTNRAVKALHAGVPVIATPTAAYRDLEGAVWLGDPAMGISAYLLDRETRTKHLALAREVVERCYSLRALTRSIAGALEVAARPREYAA